MRGMGSDSGGCLELAGVEAKRRLLCSALLRCPHPSAAPSLRRRATNRQQRSDFAKPSVVVSVARRRWRRVNAAQRSDGHGALVRGAGVAGGGATTTNCVACGETNGCVTVPLALARLIRR